MPASLSDQIGLTTSEAPFIEDARSHGDLYIRQPYESVFGGKSRGMETSVRAHAAALGAIRQSAFSGRDRIAMPQPGSGTPPRRREPVPEPAHRISRRKRSAATFPRSCFSIACAIANSPPPSPSAVPTSSIICPSRIFSTTSPATFRCTPTGISPMRWSVSASARTRPRKSSAESAMSAERVTTLTSIIRAMARFFWFTIEFGLMRSPAGLRVYGSGLLSSLRRNPARDRIARRAAVPDPARMGHQPRLRDPPLSAAAVHRRFVRPPVQPGGSSWRSG